MYSRDKHAQLAGLCGLGQVRVRRALNDLHLARSNVQALKQRLHDIERSIVELDLERESLFEQHRGITSREGLFSLRRRAGMLELRRIDLSLTRVQLDSNIEIAVREESLAQTAVAAARRERDKLDHVSRLWQKEEKIHMHLKEEINGTGGIPV
ncbi:hypothetical protein [Pandoraea fibrosis]|uniref:Flagellar FliJ protein n=1 Tax=Pandoraea fibrosis TaxID=1891094 RepID=A0A5E4SP35_9BURK|nr:hypothetical protein [Pandoraea fibrosis]VVD76663.1 hypothetical protein PFI31113_00886 [Pandoraea fibrosis]